MPRKSSRTWTISEVLDEATQLLGDGVEWLAGQDPDAQLVKSDGAESTSYMLAGQMLEVYVTAAAKVAKEVREAGDGKKLKNVSEKQLRELILAEITSDPGLRAQVEQRLRELPRAS
jgi:hypothetical protein